MAKYHIALYVAQWLLCVCKEAELYMHCLLLFLWLQTFNLSTCHACPGGCPGGCPSKSNRKSTVPVGYAGTAVMFV